jgi:putative copper export protein
MKELALTIDGKQVDPPGGLPSLPPGYTGLNQVLSTVFGILFLVAALLTIAYLIWGAIDYITSAGDKNKIHAARDKIIYAIIGLVVVLISFFIISVFGSVLNINFF